MQTIFKSSFTVGFFTLISRIFGFVRDILIAKFLGTGMASDAFFGAFKIPNFFRKIFAEGAFNSAFIPIFSSGIAKKENIEMKMFARNIFSILFYSLLIIVLLAEIFMPYLIKVILPGFNSDPEKLELAINLAKITFPYLFFISLVSMMGGVLNSLNKFAAVSAYPIILNLTFIFALLFLRSVHSNTAYVLSYAVFVGGILQFLWILYFTIKQKIFLYPVYPIRFGVNIKLFFNKFFHGCLGSGIIQLNSMVDTIIATIIPGAVSYLYYGDRLIQFPLAIIATAIGVAILPTLSKLIEKEQFQKANKTTENALFAVLFLSTPMVFGIFYFSELIVSVLFQRGMFTNADVTAVSDILKIYAFALPLFMLIKILQPSFFARKDTKTPMMISLVCLTTNVVLNLILIRIFSYRGIAIATVISSLLNVVIMSVILTKRKMFSFEEYFEIKILKIIYCSVLMFIVVLFVDRLFNNFVVLNSLFLYKILLLITVGLAGLISYLFLTKKLGLIKIKRMRLEE